jgi:hypothetical protein
MCARFRTAKAAPIALLHRLHLLLHGLLDAPDCARPWWYRLAFYPLKNVSSGTFSKGKP